MTFVSVLRFLTWIILTDPVVVGIYLAVLALVFYLALS